MSQIFNCKYCSVSCNNNYKLSRHTLKHIPWYFGSDICCVCEQKFDSNCKLLVHCQGVAHVSNVKKFRPAKKDIVLLRTKFVEKQKDQQSEELVSYLVTLINKKVNTNFDRPDGILDCVDLFPVPPINMQSMGTPELDTSREQQYFSGSLPHDFPQMPAQLETLEELENSNTYIVHGTDTSPKDVYEQPSADCSNIIIANPATVLCELPEPPMRPAKRPRSASTPTSSHEDKSLLLSKMQLLENKIEGLSRKIVDTAESQTTDLKQRIAKLEETVENNTAMVQSYSKSLTVALQQDIAKVLDTVTLIKNSNSGPPMSQTMMSALLTLSQEAVKIYEAPYQPNK